MPDISMCDGENCARKKDCYRFTAKPDPHWQVYFNNSPIKKDGGCDYFWQDLRRQRQQHKNPPRGG